MLVFCSCSESVVSVSLIYMIWIIDNTVKYYSCQRKKAKTHVNIWLCRCRKIYDCLLTLKSSLLSILLRTTMRTMYTRIKPNTVMRTGKFSSSLAPRFRKTDPKSIVLGAVTRPAPRLPNILLLKRAFFGSDPGRTCKYIINMQNWFSISHSFS